MQSVIGLDENQYQRVPTRLHEASAVGRQYGAPHVLHQAVPALNSILLIFAHNAH